MADETSHSFFFGRWVVPQVVDMAMSSFEDTLSVAKFMLLLSYSNLKWNDVQT